MRVQGTNAFSQSRAGGSPSQQQQRPKATPMPPGVVNKRMRIPHVPLNLMRSEESDLVDDSSSSSSSEDGGSGGRMRSSAFSFVTNRRGDKSRIPRWWIVLGAVGCVWVITLSLVVLSHILSDKEVPPAADTRLRGTVWKEISFNLSGTVADLIVTSVEFDRVKRYEVCCKSEQDGVVECGVSTGVQCRFIRPNIIRVASKITKHDTKCVVYWYESSPNTK